MMRLIDEQSEERTEKTDYPFADICPHRKTWIGECRDAETCRVCPFRLEFRKAMGLRRYRRELKVVK